MSAPVITTQPSDTSAVVGASASFTVVATGATSYAWFKTDPIFGGFSVIGGATTATLTIPTVVSADFCQFYVIVTNSDGSTTSSTVTLSRAATLAITAQPAPVATVAGNSASLTIGATCTAGSSAISYEWFYFGSLVPLTNGGAISGATTATLTISPASSSQSFFCKVINASNAGETLVSDTAALTVSNPTTTGPGGGTITVPPGGLGGVFPGFGIIIPPGTANMGAWQGIARAKAAAAAGNGAASVRDGDLVNAKPCGPPMLTFPFQDKGDKLTVIWKQKYRQGAEYFQGLQPYSTHPDRSDYYLIKETDPEDKGAAVWIWERWYCPVPATHFDFEDYPYTLQYVASRTSMGGFTNTVSSQIKYEYFLEKDAAAFPIIQKDYLYVMPTTVLNAGAQGGGVTFFRSGTNSLYVGNPGTVMISDSALIVAENSKISIWNYPIMCRATRYVPGPKMGDIGTVYVPPGS